MDETDSDIYPLHRKLYELVQTRGMFQLDSDLFSRAYFEESDPGLPSDERNEHWHTLMSAINLAYPLEWERPDGTVRKCNLLVVLDDIVLEHGIEGAIDAMANVQYKTEGSFRAKID